jgi:hypothetical protein
VRKGAITHSQTWLTPQLQSEKTTSAFAALMASAICWYPVYHPQFTARIGCIPVLTAEDVLVRNTVSRD